MKAVALVTRVLKAVVAALVAGTATYTQNQDVTAAVVAAAAAGLAVWAAPNSSV